MDRGSAKDVTSASLSEADVAALADSLGAVEPATPLGCSDLGPTYRFTLSDGEHVVVRSAPRGVTNRLCCQSGAIRSEAAVLRLVTVRAQVPMPSLLRADFTHALIDADYLVVEHLPGAPWPVLSGSQVADADHSGRSFTPARRALGQAMAGLHRIVAPQPSNARALYGYLNFAVRLHGTTWAEAFRGMVTALLQDAQRWNVRVPIDSIHGALEMARDCLELVERPALIHGDMRPHNVFLDPGDLHVVGIAGGARAVWGDPLFDLTAAQPLHTAEVHPDILTGYVEAAGELPLAGSGRHASEHPAGPRAAVHTPALSYAANQRLSLYRLYQTLVTRVAAAAGQFTTDPAIHPAVQDEVLVTLLSQLPT